MGKTNTGLVAYAEAMLGKPYWMGTFGQTASEWLYEYNKQRLPQFYTANDFPTQYGQRVHDCIGLIKGYLWSTNENAPPQYTGWQDVDADTMRKLCNTGGTIRTIPEIPGVLVFAPAHVGVYIGNGEVIEARGHAFGVVKTKLKSRPFEHWGMCPWIDYGDGEVETEEDTAPVPAEKTEMAPTSGTVMLTPLPIIRKGSKGMAVWAMQTLLNSRGFDCGDADGDCGENTAAAIMALQIAYGLGVDGECGKMTWAVLING